MPESITRNFVRPFDLTRAPLLRVGVIKEEDNRHILMVDMHHITADGISHTVLMKDFAAIYRGQELAGLRIHYKDYSRWLSKESRQETLEAQEAYWLKEFAAAVPVLNLPIDYPRPPIQSVEGNTCSFTVAKEETAKIKKLAAQYEVTLYMMFLALLNLLMSKLSGNEDLVVGTVISGRNHTDLQKIVGMFVNVLCLRNFPAKGKTFAAFLTEVKERALRSFQNQDYQFQDLVGKIDLNRDPARHPVFDVGLEFQGDEWSTERETEFQVNLPQLAIQSYPYEKKLSRLDMTLYGRDARDHLEFHFEYCTKLFKEETIQNFIKYFKTLLAVVLEEPGKELGDIDIIPAEEFQKIKDQLQEKNREMTIDFDL